ncbi:hypothetical protein B2J88_45035 [Rhodococcus sp. SRB_17]|nr:hypothetical protein [Rhodococcus sp. SRB_17]
MQNSPQHQPTSITAVAANRSGTIALRATEQAVPIDLRIHQDELRYGGSHLARNILALANRAGLEAGARHRIELEGSGVPDAILTALGLATREQLAEAQDAAEQAADAPTTWMRAI